jgi:alkylation response protein AidB-like acyl-CoA dehydrogenase
MAFQQELDQIVNDIVAPKATEIDESARFPRAAVDALTKAGILSLTISPEYGGLGGSLRDAAHVVRSLSRACGSTAMVVMMHYSAVAALVAADRTDELTDIAANGSLSTLAFSEYGSRSHFWAPMSSATAADGGVLLNARKSWVTAAHEADSFVWSSRPAAASGPMSLWFVPAGSPGLAVAGSFDGLGLRGNDSCPMTAEDVRVPASALIGADGAGLDLALAAVLPTFLVLNASASTGLLEAVTDETIGHLRRARLDHLDQSLAQQPLPRAAAAQMRIDTDRTAALVDAALTAMEQHDERAQLLVLEVKAAADESAAGTADLAMKTCGGAAFRKELGIERRFRDSRAARVMAPTTAALQDFVGRALCGLPLLDGPDT